MEKMDEMIQIYNRTEQICFDDKKIYLLYCQRSSPFNYSEGRYHRRSVYAAPDRKK